LLQVKAMHKGEWGDAGTLVELDVQADDTPAAIKDKLTGKVGIPVESIKLRLGALNQIMFGDKRTNIMHGTCGATSGLGLTYVARASPPRRA
jgi:thiamine phosphate synthase YjbQ (UPF0047 family)